MFLRSLTLKGFKSFAETTTLHFQPGVTVVVGPNGSGKSNVVDAVAWVLGAQGPSTVRSSKMDDVVFAGSANRPALGRAEVSLTIDNTSGLLPIEFSEVTLTRTLFRSSGESEYAINGVPCRLLDIQELLSDTGVGRQQHVIVSQGQLDQVLNARPEDRRAIVEEAAGVLKYRRRREKAQRRLEATEGSLVRLQDLLREVRRQLRPLDRQADAARRHGSVVEELRALRLHVAGREIARLGARAEAGARAKGESAAIEARCKADLTGLDADVLAAERGLAAIDATGLHDVVARLEALRERARGLVALIAERRRSLERDRLAVADESLVGALEAESSSLGGELAEIEAAATALAPQTHDLARAESELAREREGFEGEWGDGPATASGGTAETRGELGALRTSLDRGRTELARLASRLSSLEQRAQRLDETLQGLGETQAQADRDWAAAVAAQRDADTGLATAEAELVEADSQRRHAEADHRAAAARVDALALALDEARARAGTARLAGLHGVLGALVDLVEVDHGWEAAFEAAVGEALAAVVVDSPERVGEAVGHLKEGATTGAVLALGRARVDAALPLLGEPVRPHVRSTEPGVEALLDALLATAVLVRGGWRQALDVAIAHPDAIAVTSDGDRYTATSSRVGAGGPGATGAALDEARGHAERATEAIAVAEGRVAVARVERDAAADGADETRAAVEAQERRRRATDEQRQQARAERRDLSTERSSLEAHAQELTDRVAAESARVSELEAALPALEAEEAAGAERAAAMRSARRRLDERSSAVAALRRDLEVRAAQLETRRAEVARRRDDVDARLARHHGERQRAAARRREHELGAQHLARLAELVHERKAFVEGELARQQERRKRQSDAARTATERIEALRAERATTERSLDEARERARRAELDEAEARMRLEAATESLRHDLDCEPAMALAAECPELPPGTTAPGRVRELERELRLMGPINPLALEEFTALQERHAFLEEQLDDVKRSRRELAKVIRAVDAEIVEVFAAAYADVSENFCRLFETLFPGGQGRLRLTDPDNLLETGIEVEARPPGKHLRKLSLLSGGERSLTALAFLFAVFRSRPSPFYLLDEVEAALDDVNLHRFLELMREFRDEAQLVVVSHQKRTMEAADTLYGVTMQPGGSSRVISELVTARA